MSTRYIIEIEASVSKPERERLYGRIEARIVDGTQEIEFKTDGLHVGTFRVVRDDERASEQEPDAKLNHEQYMAACSIGVTASNCFGVDEDGPRHDQFFSTFVRTLKHHAHLFVPRAPSASIEAEAMEALRSLANVVDGLNYREHEIREAIGNTNWSVLRHHAHEARALLRAETQDGVR